MKKKIWSFRRLSFPLLLYVAFPPYSGETTTWLFQIKGKRDFNNLQLLQPQSKKKRCRFCEILNFKFCSQNKNSNRKHGHQDRFTSYFLCRNEIIIKSCVCNFKTLHIMLVHFCENTKIKKIFKVSDYYFCHITVPFGCLVFLQSNRHNNKYVSRGDWVK